MSNEKIIVLILICVIVLLYIVYLIRKKLRREYVKKTSCFYNKIIELNNTFELKCFFKEFRFHKQYKSKSAVDKSNLVDVAIQYISENLDYVKKCVSDYEECEQIYKLYKNNVNDITKMKFDYSCIKMNKLLFKSKNDYILLECDLIEDAILKNRNNLALYVYVDYRSPGGRNHWIKDYEFSYDKIIELISVVEHREEYMKSAKYQRSILSDSLRYDVLKRDNFTCQLCGVSKSDGVKLEVDHIYPVSKGGKTEMKNLQTLCERCNRGKRDKI